MRKPSTHATARTAAPPQPTEPPKNDVPGFPCPSCTFRIKLSLQDVLYAHEIKCANCGAAMGIDRSNARRLMTLLQDVYVAEKNVKALQKQSL